MKLSDVASKVVDLGDKIRDYYEKELPKAFRNYPLVSPGETEPPPPPEEKKLRQFLSSLPDELLQQLIVIMQFGWLAFGPAELAERQEAMRAEFADREYAIARLMNEPTLALQLMEGLDELRKHNIDVDNLPLKKIKVRKR
jgi:hypothetical protein